MWRGGSQPDFLSSLFPAKRSPHDGPHLEVIQRLLSDTKMLLSTLHLRIPIRTRALFLRIPFGAPFSFKKSASDSSHSTPPTTRKKSLNRRESERSTDTRFCAVEKQLCFSCRQIRCGITDRQCASTVPHSRHIECNKNLKCHGRMISCLVKERERERERERELVLSDRSELYSSALSHWK